MADTTVRNGTVDLQYRCDRCTAAFSELPENHFVCPHCGGQVRMVLLHTDHKMPEMITRVAEAIWSFYGNAPAKGWAHTKNTEPEFSARTYQMARAAIAAMREPTAGMIAAAPDRAIKSIEVIGLGPAKATFSDPAVNWRAMIDAALGE